MKPNTAPLGRQYACICGDSHPSLLRLFNANVLPCPAITEPGLHLVIPVNKPGMTPAPPYLRMAEDQTAFAEHMAAIEARMGKIEEGLTPDVVLTNVQMVLANLESRIAALEKKREKA